MQRFTICFVALVLLLAPSTAGASYMLTKGQARDFSNSEISTRYQDLGIPDSGGQQTCRPQKSKWNRVTKNHAHRWVCSWKAATFHDTTCVGQVLIVGTRVDLDNTYYRAILQPARCTG